MSKKLILFDFDGTIADTKFIAYDVYLDIAKRYGLKILSEEEIKAFHHDPLRKKLKAYDIPLSKLPGLMRQAAKIFHEKIEAAPVFDGIPRLIARLKERGDYVAIVSSNRKAIIDTFLRHHRWAAFDAVHGKAPMFKKEKSIQKIMKKFKVDKHQTLYIGDELRDIEACQRFSIDILAVTWGYDPREILETAQPKYLFDTVEALSQYLLDD